MSSQSPSQSPATAEAPASQRAPSPRARRRFGGVLAPLGNGNFRLLVSGQLISNIGDMFYAVALPWYMLTQGGGAQNLGIVLLAYGIPRIGTVLLGGTLADRFRPRRVMLGADVARAGLTGALAGLVMLGNPPLWQLCAVSALLGAFSGLFMPGSFSILPDVLPDEQLQAGNAFNSSSAQLATLVGAGVAGAVVTFFTPGLALAVDAGTFIVSAVSLAAMRPARLMAPSASQAADEDVEGVLAGGAVPEASLWRWLATSRLFQVILLIAMIGNLTIAGVSEVALPQVAKTLPGGGAGAFGILLAAFGVGALAGGFGAGALGGIRGRGVLMMLIWIVQGVVIALVPFAGSVTLAAGALAGMGLTNALSNVIAFTAIQQKTPRALLGRVMSVLMLTSLASYPLSVAVAGVVTERYGPAILFVVCGALLVLATMYGLFQRELRQI